MKTIRMIHAGQKFQCELCCGNITTTLGTIDKCINFLCDKCYNKASRIINPDISWKRYMCYVEEDLMSCENMEEAMSRFYGLCNLVYLPEFPEIPYYVHGHIKKLFKTIYIYSQNPSSGTFNIFRDILPYLDLFNSIGCYAPDNHYLLTDSHLQVLFECWKYGHPDLTSDFIPEYPKRFDRYGWFCDNPSFNRQDIAKLNRCIAYTNPNNEYKVSHNLYDLDPILSYRRELIRIIDDSKILIPDVLSILKAYLRLDNMPMRRYHE